MRIVFAGTPEFAAAPLRALLADGADITAIYTQPDRPAGRGRRLQVSPVKRVAQDHGLPLQQPESLREEADQSALAALAPDLMLVIAYGLILPPAVLAIPRLGCVNLHASLLPRWRGAAPIQRAIAAGDAESGVCLMQMDAGLDTGPVLARHREEIPPGTTGGQLHDRLMQASCERLPGWLRRLAAGDLQARPQPEAGVCYAPKLSKDEARVDWTQDAVSVARLVQAFDPWPVASAALDGQRLRLWGARAESGDGRPGEVLAEDSLGLKVACGQGCVRITELQWPGGRRMPAVEAARGHPLLGQRFAV